MLEEFVPAEIVPGSLLHPWTSTPADMPLLLWIPGLPLAAFTLLILVGRRIGRASGWVAATALAGSCGAAYASLWLAI